MGEDLQKAMQSTSSLRYRRGTLPPASFTRRRAERCPPCNTIPVACWQWLVRHRDGRCTHWLTLRVVYMHIPTNLRSCPGDLHASPRRRRSLYLRIFQEISWFNNHRRFASSSISLSLSALKLAGNEPMLRDSPQAMISSRFSSR